MKNRNKIVAIATSMVTAVAALVGGMTTEVYAVRNYTEADYGTCQYCGAEIKNIMDIYKYGTLPEHEGMCLKNPNRHGADGFSKEESEIEIDIPDESEIEIDIPDEPTKPVEPTEQPTEPVKPVEPTEQPTEPVKPVEPIVTFTNRVSGFSKGEVIVSFELPDNSDNEITVPDNKAEIEALEAEALEARKLADEARAEADRLEAIAIEKEAALEAARQ